MSPEQWVSFLFVVVVVGLSGPGHALYSNPCNVTDAICRSGTLTDRCGYGSACVGRSLDCGVCQYQSLSLGCGVPCFINPLTTTLITTADRCSSGSVCAQGTSESFATCGQVGNGFAPYLCNCTANAQCESSLCDLTTNTCSLAGKGRGAWGFPCTSDSDCVSGICTSGVCAGVAPGGSCFFSAMCGKGYRCKGSICIAYQQIGDACTYSDRAGCNPDTSVCSNITNTCVPFFGVDDGGACTSTGAKECLSTSSCWGGVRCAPGGSCPSSVFFSDANVADDSCPYGQSCGCSSSSGQTPSCGGELLTQDCADAYNAYKQCLYTYSTMGNMGAAVPQNYMPTPDPCRTAFRNFYCSSLCSPGFFAYNGGVDYNLIDCCAGGWVPYNTSQNNNCYRQYCKTNPYSPSMSSGCSASSSSSSSSTGTYFASSSSSSGESDGSSSSSSSSSTAPARSEGTDLVRNNGYAIAFTVLGVAIAMAVMYAAVLLACPKSLVRLR